MYAHLKKEEQSLHNFHRNKDKEPIQLAKKSYSSCQPWKDNYTQGSTNAKEAIKSYFGQSDHGRLAGNFAEEIIINSYRSNTVMAEYGIPKATKNATAKISSNDILALSNNQVYQKYIIPNLKEAGVINSGYLSLYWRSKIDSSNLRTITFNKNTLVNFFEGEESTNFNDQHGYDLDIPMGFADIVIDDKEIYEIKPNNSGGLARGQQDVRHYVAHANMRPLHQYIAGSRSASHSEEIDSDGHKLTWNNSTSKEVIGYEFEYQFQEQLNKIKSILYGYSVFYSDDDVKEVITSLKAQRNMVNLATAMLIGKKNLIGEAAIRVYRDYKSDAIPVEQTLVGFLSTEYDHYLPDTESIEMLIRRMKTSAETKYHLQPK